MTMSTAEAVLSEVLDAFDFGAPVVGAPRYGCGSCQTSVPCESRNPSKPR